MAITCLICGLAAACADTNKSASRSGDIRDRQDEVLRDPFSYEPRRDMPSVSGGGTAEFDKEGFKRDWDSFWGR